MTQCNDQLIDQLLTQAEQEGRCLIPPSTAIRKALLRRTELPPISWTREMGGFLCVST